MKIKSIILIVAFTVLSVSTSALGKDRVDGRWYIAPGVNYIYADNDRDAGDDFGLRLGIGKAVSSKWNVEFNALVDNLDSDTYGEFKQSGISLNALYFFNRDAKLSPYGVAGIGALQTKLPGEKSTNVMAELGAGLSFSIMDGGALRFEARHRYDGNDSSVSGEDRFNDWLAGLTLAVPLGKKPVEEKVREVVKPAPAPVPPPPVLVPKDDDGDGVSNDIDRCPDTPTGVSVDSSGCPTDSDKDGVADYMDKCPGTHADVKVDSKGCPVDSDGDGVADHVDKCPDTKPNTLVDDKGCALPEKVSITLKIEFDTAKAVIQPKYHGEIKGLADFMIKYPTTTVEIGGHTDNVGKEVVNVGLSQRRADAVKKSLVEEFGIDASRVSAKGYGPSKPIADNSTASGRQQNRRVEAVIETMIRTQ